MTIREDAFAGKRKKPHFFYWNKRDYESAGLLFTRCWWVMISPSGWHGYGDTPFEAMQMAEEVRAQHGCT